ncbi:MAG: hypothetical protein LBH97_06160 [Treponema sp.]|jgi:uncharacterized membrane protein YhaH (DUF805 family)|nr:hypothetical protein [Treponema sp.]
MSEERIPKRVKIDEKWYRAGKEADGTFIFKDDLNYHGSTTKIEYTAKKPNPVLHPNFFHIFNANGSQVGEFWTEPKSYSGCITDLETEEGDGNISGNSSDSSSYEASSRPERSDWSFVMAAILFLIRPFIELFTTGFWTKYFAWRKDWWRTLGSMLLFYFVLALLGILGSDNVVVMIVFLVLPLIPIVTVSISRVRDAGKPWWLALIPGVNFILCAFFPSKD